MRKTLIIVIAMLISASALYATGQVGLNPGHGGFGINMATTEYNFKDGLHYEKPNEIAGTKNAYTDTHMVALGGVWNMYSPHESFAGWGSFDNSECETPMHITVECPTGFYFESTSNPGARRPFELYVIVKESYSDKINDSGGDEPKTNTEEKVYVFREGDILEKSHTYGYTKPKEGIVSTVIQAAYQYQYMWFDVVLCLPYDDTQGTNYVTSEGKMTYKNREYTLVEADDYTAIVTITLSWGEGEKKQSRSITIPLRGYYSANITEQDSTASLSVRPRASAANLSIETMQGVEVPIADIDFMATGYPEKDTNGNYVYTANGNFNYLYVSNYYMFLSASRNPLESDSNGFRLIRRNRGYTESPYSEDYLGFTVRITPTITTGKNEIFDFDGTKVVSETKGLSITDGLINIPNVKSSSDTGGDVYFAQFQGVVSIIMDQATTVMNDGIYEEEIYVHIVTDEE